MKTIGALLLSSVVGLNVYNYNNPGREITIEYVLNKTDNSPVVDVSPAPSLSYLDTVVVKKKRSPIASTAYAEYIQNHVSLAKEIEVKYGVPSHIVIAQAIHESGGGKSYLGRKANNHLGIKACKKCNFIKGTTAKWHKFDTVADCYYRYGEITRTLHDRLLNKYGIDSISTFTVAISGYAGADEYKTINGVTYKGNFSYMHKLNSIIQDYNLEELCKNHCSQ